MNSLSLSAVFRRSMEATLVQPYNNAHDSFLPPRINRSVSMQNHRRRSQSTGIRSTLADNSVDVSSVARQSQTVYNDNLFDRLAINHLSHCLQASTGLRNEKRGYDGLVEAATVAARHFSPIEQRQIIIQTLEMAIPKPILSLIKTVLKPSKFAREYFAVFTTFFFAWLVGPCEVREAEFDGKKEKSVVHIPKCRFLEETNCVGMCTNLCKMPSQTFIKESLGMPIYMVPNFDDMSCDMKFGQEPPAQSLDPAFTQPCYKQCKSSGRHQKNCTK
ncbi:beta-carotene isomerase D27, chloroplastic [Andrographis paniculata]|uniref:beta-carotene isomerase D27, chloroplastic n=1 Tax=Andrographis paniculata TaxID=175694 RepID=UPI0021E71F95|nr:beta-carotene isomerase D27, chloroplastic [Andrographis paniculata]XP_051142273.1 beta-carotene isomerase D27, chloroplastic [Andrographis paniculata]XP_051142274.1 beta-carotene isomerase D27, chloroplastic [Andrographis paniculata]